MKIILIFIWRKETKIWLGGKNNMKVRPREVDEALDYLLDYECFTPYTNRITLIRDYILELEEKNNIKTDLIGDIYGQRKTETRSV